MPSSSLSRTVLDRDGRLLRLTLTGDEKYRIFTPLNEIHPDFVDAVLMREDRHFYGHLGVNPVALVKAALHTYIVRTRRIGGSTITMQLARMTSTRGSKTIFGKAHQIARAISIELYHSKHEILEAYLNLLPYGGNIEGVGAASAIHFGKKPSELSLAEILTLAVIPQNPNARFAQNEAEGLKPDPGLVLARKRLMEAWSLRHPSRATAERELRLGVNAKNQKELPFLAPHFVNLALDRSWSEESEKSSKIETTLDLALQTTLEKRLAAYVASKKQVGVQNAAAMIVNHETMEVLAQVGSVDFFDSSIEGQVNGALAKRSPGSTLKPFVYGLALDQGLIHPMTILKDTPMSFGAFDPENYDRGFAGPVSATQSLIRSRNVPAVYLASLLKGMNLYDLLKTSGVRDLREQEYYGLAVALGGAEVTMEDLAKLYAMLARRGELAPLQYFKNVRPADESARSLLSPEASFLVLDMLRQNPIGAAAEQGLGLEDFVRDSIPVAWKTGTSHGFRDAWTAGVVGPYVIVVWLGNFNNDSNPAFIGRDLAAPLFFRIVDSLKNKVGPEQKWLSTEGLKIKKLEVCSLSGQQPSRHCSHQTKTWFIPNRSPIDTCTVHREVMISAKSGLRACDESVPEGVGRNVPVVAQRSVRRDVRREVYEFWPSDLLRIFRLAGLPRRTPPAFEGGCGVEHTKNFGVAPLITSPRRDVTYTMRLSSERAMASEERIPLQATTDGDTKFVHWFVGTDYLGRSEPSQPLMWLPRAGRYVVRAVDDHGRSSTRSIVVRAVK